MERRLYNNEYKRMAEPWKNSISKVRMSNELRYEDILRTRSTFCLAIFRMKIYQRMFRFVLLGLF